MPPGRRVGKIRVCFFVGFFMVQRLTGGGLPVSGFFFGFVTLG